MPGINPAATDQSLMLSKPNVGKEVRFLDTNPELVRKARQLLAAADKRAYYPMLAKKQLASLQTGLIGKNNVFIPNLNTSQVTRLQVFYVFVPGIRATVERRPNDSFVITDLELSDGFDALKSASEEKPGVYSVQRQGSEIKVEYNHNDKITPVNGRRVVITDGDYLSPKDAASDALKRLKDTAGEDTARIGKFDMLFSPIGKSLGGMRNYNAATITDGYAFASILAGAMADTQDKEDIQWISEFGGSVVFTQAMEIAVRNRLSFEGKNHGAHMYEPRTDINHARQLARQLDFNLGDNFAKASRPYAVAGNFLSKAARARDGNDSYSYMNYSKDLATGGMGATALIGVGAFVGGLALTSPLVTAVGTVTSGIGALGLLVSKTRKLLEKPKG